MCAATVLEVSHEEQRNMIMSHRDTSEEDMQHAVKHEEEMQHAVEEEMQHAVKHLQHQRDFCLSVLFFVLFLLHPRSPK